MIRVIENKIMYHVSSGPIERFDTNKSVEIGLHVGDEDVARTFIYGRYSSQDCYVYEIEFDDSDFKFIDRDFINTWVDYGVLNELLDIKDPRYEEYYIRLQKARSELDRSAVFRDILKDLGYKGIKYKNTIEGTGDSYSYILIDKDTIKDFHEIQLEEL